MDQRSCLVLPLVVQDRLLAYLYADIDGAFGRFHASDQDLLAMLASQAAVALDNTQWAQGLEAKVQERTAALDARVAELEVISAIQRGVAGELDFQAIATLVGDKLREVFHTGDLSMVWLEESGNMVQTLYNYEHGKPIAHRPPRPLPPQDSPLTQNLLQRQVAVFPTREHQAAAGLVPAAGTDQCHSAITVPVVGSNRVVGFFTLQDHVREYAYDEADVQLLQTIAASMGVALENARLVEQTQEALEQQTASADILRVISDSPTDVTPVFDALVATGVRLLACDMSFVFLCRDNAIAVVAGASPAGPMDVSMPDLPLDVHDNFPAQAVAAMEKLHLPDWSAIDLPEHEARIRQAFGIGSALYVPMVRDGICIGLLSYARSRAQAFSDKEIAIAESFRDQAVIAIRERAAVQRDARGIGAPDRHRRHPAYHQRIAHRCDAGVPGDCRARVCAQWRRHGWHDPFRWRADAHAGLAWHAGRGRVRVA